MADFKPNLYPMMYWGLMYGVMAGLVLVVINFLSQFITIVWFPVFLAGVIWGGYRNYVKQKKEAGSTVKKSVVDELKSAVQDVVTATGEMMAENDAEAVAEEAPVAGEGIPVNVQDEENERPPETPTPPTVSNLPRQDT